MNLEQLTAMSDAELNELSAVKVMNSDYFKDSEGRIVIRLENGGATFWSPTSDMNDAMELWNKLYSDLWELSLYCNQKLTYPWDCRMFLNDGFDKEKRVIAHEKTASRAITIASILALE